MSDQCASLYPPLPDSCSNAHGEHSAMLCWGTAGGSCKGPLVPRKENEGTQGVRRHARSTSSIYQSGFG
eukprot:3065466-Amphidinium_carterae.2